MSNCCLILQQIIIQQNHVKTFSPPYKMYSSAIHPIFLEIELAISLTTLLIRVCSAKFFSNASLHMFPSVSAINMKLCFSKIKRVAYSNIPFDGGNCFDKSVLFQFIITLPFPRVLAFTSLSFGSNSTQHFSDGFFES